jgi:hypothetical protein
MRESNVKAMSPDFASPNRTRDADINGKSPESIMSIRRVAEQGVDCPVGRYLRTEKQVSIAETLAGKEVKALRTKPING